MEDSGLYRMQTVNEFFESLADKSITIDYMQNRIELDILARIDEYNKNLEVAIKNSVDKLDYTLSDILSASMIIGYLLKSHIDRYELTQKLKLD